jgi:hypothetical protein
LIQGTASGVPSDESSYTFDPNTWSTDSFNKNKHFHNNPSSSYSKIHEPQNSGMIKNKFTERSQMKSYSKQGNNQWNNKKQVTNQVIGQGMGQVISQGNGQVIGQGMGQLTGQGLGQSKSMPKYSTIQQSSRGRSIKSSQFHPSQSILQLDELTDQENLFIKHLIHKRSSKYYYIN